MDNLKKRGHIIVNWCPMCFAEEESSSHLLIHCSFSKKVWAEILNRFGLS